MKRVAIIGGVIVLLCIGVFALALSQSGTIISRFQPELESRIGEALGSQVHMESIDLSVFPTTSLNLKRLSLTDPSDENKVLTVQNGVLKISLLSLLGGNLKIDALQFEKPRVQIRQLKKGIAIDGIPVKSPKGKKGGKKKKKKAGEGVSASKPKESGSGLPAWLSVNLDHAAIKEGEFIFHPLAKGKDEQKSYRAKDIELSTSLALADGKVSLSRLKLFTDISTKGEIDLDIESGSYHLESGTLELQSGSVEADLRGSPFGAITTDLSGIKVVAPQQEISFEKIAARLLGGTISLGGNYKGESQDGDFQLLADKIEHNGEMIGAKGNATVRKGEVSLQNTKITIADSVLAINAKSKPFTPTQPFAAEFKVEKPLRVERLVKAAKPPKPVPLTGTLEQFSLNAKGELKPSVTKTIAGETSLKLVDGEFTGGNLPMMVLQSLKDVPFLSEKIQEAIPEKQRGELQKDSTAIDLLQTTATLKNEAIHTEGLVFKSTLFSLNARGTIGLQGALDLETTFRFIPDISLAMAQKVKELKNLLDKEDQLVIPLQIRGTTTAPVVLPDVEELMKLGAGEKIKKEAGRLLDKVLGSDDDDAEDGKPSKSKQLVDDVGKIFGF